MCDCSRVLREIVYLGNFNWGDVTRAGNLILTALTIGRVTLRNAAKNKQFVLAQDVYDTRLGEWASAA